MRAFEIPDNRSEQIAWLEAEVVGTQLHSLVAELTAVHGEDTSAQENATKQSTNQPGKTWEGRWTESTRNAVRERGLAVLSDEQFTELLQCSRQLLYVQRDVLEHGGRYWSEVKPPTDLNGAPSLSTTSISSDSLSPLATTTSPWKSNIASAVIAALATAAAVLLFLRPAMNSDLSERPSPKSVDVAGNPGSTLQDTDPVQPKLAWGFAKFANGIQADAENLAPPLNREAYLQELAKAAEAWSNKRPKTRHALAERIGEFRMGCSAILLAKHEVLPESDRAWLGERCQSWAAALDRHLADVEAGKSVEEVRQEVDSTVTKIAAALLGRADTPTG